MNLKSLTSEEELLPEVEDVSLVVDVASDIDDIEEEDKELEVESDFDDDVADEEDDDEAFEFELDVDVNEDSDCEVDVAADVEPDWGVVDCDVDEGADIETDEVSDTEEVLAGDVEVGDNVSTVEIA